MIGRLAIAVFVIGCSSRREEAIAEAETAALEARLKIEQEHAKDLELAKLRAKEREKSAAQVPALLAKLAVDQGAMTATRVAGSNPKTWTYDLPQFASAELRQVAKHPEAWSWWLTGPKGIAIADFGPPGSVRDLLGGAAPIGGFAVGGVIHRVDAGPLAGAIVLAGPDGKSFSVSSVAYHRLSPDSMIMPALCDLGVVDGVPADGAIKFKDACFAAIAAKVGKPERELFPRPWMLRVGTDNACKHSYDETINGRTYSCSDATGKLVVKVTRAP